MKKTMSMLVCQRILVILWFLPGGLLALVVWLQSSLGHYGPNGTDAIEWLLPFIFPIFTLIAGGWVANELKQPRSKAKINSLTFIIVACGSFLYLGFIGLILAIQPMDPRPPMDELRGSSSLLTAFQGVVGILLGIFFSTKTE